MPNIGRALTLGQRSSSSESSADMRFISSEIAINFGRLLVPDLGIEVYVNRLIVILRLIPRAVNRVCDLKVGHSGILNKSARILAYSYTRTAFLGVSRQEDPFELEK